MTKEQFYLFFDRRPSSVIESNLTTTLCRSHHHTPHFHAPGLSLGVNYPQVMHFSAEDHHVSTVKKEDN